MPKVTIYTRPVDDEVWAWARGKSAQDRDSLARIVADALRAYRTACEDIADKEDAER